MEWETVIGLEVHAQLITNKNFFRRIDCLRRRT